MLQKFDKSSFEKLLLEYQKDIYNFALFLCKDSNDAHDLLQETNIKALSNINKYNHENKNKFKNWILLMTRNIFINNYRCKIKRNYNKIEFNPSLLQEVISSNETDQDINYQELISIIKTIPDNLLILAFFNGYTYKQLSEIYGIKEGTLKSRLFDVKQKIKNKLSKENYESRANCKVQKH